MPFCEKGGTTQRVTDFCANKNRNKAKSVPTQRQATKALKEKMRRRRRAPEKPIGLSNRRRAPKRLVAQRRRYVRIYKDIAAASVTFWDKGGVAMRRLIFLI